MTTSSTPTQKYVGLFRRLFAIFYDTFLLCAALLIVSAIFTSINGGEAITRGTILYVFFLFSLVAVSFLYFGWFWTHGGQTLGMQTWRIKLVDINGNSASWKQALIRFITSIFSWLCLGLGFIWSKFTHKKQSWHGLLSQTVLLDLRD